MRDAFHLLTIEYLSLRYLSNLSRIASFFIKAYVDMVVAMNWNSFVVLYEDSEGLVRLQEVLKLSSVDADIKITVRQLLPGPGGDYRYLSKLKLHYYILPSIFFFHNKLSAVVREGSGGSNEPPEFEFCSF